MNPELPANPHPIQPESVTPLAPLSSVAPSTDASSAAPAAVPAFAVPVLAGVANWLMPVLVVLALLALGALWFGWQAQRQTHSLEQELVRRQQESSAQAAEARVLAKAAEDASRDAVAKVASLETRLSEVAMQRSQLEELMQSLSRSRDENLVTDIDAALRVSLQQTAITGSAEPLVAALRSAEERLARVSATQPRLDSVRRAIARDLDRVRSVGVPDMGSLLIKLDECIRLIDELPLLSSNAVKVPGAVAARDSAAPAPAADPAASASPLNGRIAAVGRWWNESSGLIETVWGEVRALVRVTRIDQPESMLLAPDQSFMMRENLKLRLLNARLALLSRQTESAQGDLQNAISAVKRYFDPASRRTQVALELLKQVATQGRQANLPRPDETLTALTAAAAGR